MTCGHRASLPAEREINLWTGDGGGAGGELGSQMLPGVPDGKPNGFEGTQELQQSGPLPQMPWALMHWGGKAAEWLREVVSRQVALGGAVSLQGQVHGH